MTVARVTHPEANLLTMARWAVGAAGSTEALRLLLLSASSPAKLGPTSAALLQDTLSRGTALALLREGGWTLEAGSRLWNGTLPPLRFTANIVRVLQWVLTTSLAEVEVPPLTIVGPFTPAEEAFVALLLSRARGTAAETCLMRQPVFRAAPLVQLMHAGPLGQVGPLEVVSLTPAHLPFVRGLLDLLGDCWLEAERLKRHHAQPRVLMQVGRAQTVVAEAFLQLIDRQNERLLARFFIDAAAAWLSTETSSSALVGLDPETPMRERAEARTAAASLWRVIGRLDAWDQQHRTTHFIDDGYAVAQALTKDWERLGPAGFAAATRLVTELEGLPT